MQSKIEQGNVMISQELGKQLLVYLARCPYGEVNQLCAELASAQVIPAPVMKEKLIEVKKPKAG